VTQYAALLRGIGPGNPNMRNEKLRGVCEDLGLDNVQTVISSGNVVFESEGWTPGELESTLEEAWPSRLGFESTTIVRTRSELESLVQLDPFGILEHSRETYLLVTFAKCRLKPDFAYPHKPEDKEYRIVGATSREMFSVTDTTAATSPDVMGWMERQFGKEITSRTWLTVGRILRKMGAD
jgi:uncharacterized protein (DUF1697 family)